MVTLDMWCIIARVARALTWGTHSSWCIAMCRLREMIPKKFLGGKETLSLKGSCGLLGTQSAVVHGIGGNGVGWASNGYLQVGDSAPGKAQAVCQAFQGLYKAAPGGLNLLLQVVECRVQVVKQLGDARHDVLSLDLIKERKGRVLQ